MSLADALLMLADELALVAAIGALILAFDDLLVDLVYGARALWRAVAVYSMHPRAVAAELPPGRAGWLAILVPAWDEGEVVAAMVRRTLRTFEGVDYRLYVGVYRNDCATAAALADIDDGRLRRVRVEVDGPTSKADCLNWLYAALETDEARMGRPAKGVVLHDAEDLVHAQELRLFHYLLDRAGVVQLPVIALPDPASRWIAGHYCDEFASAHGRDMVVREAVGASVPLAGVAAAIRRDALARLAIGQRGRPFAADSLTEDYELGLRLGQAGERTIFVRMLAARGRRGIVASAGAFPAQFDAAVRQKGRWLMGIALGGWDRLGWSGGWGERWFRWRDRRTPLTALLLVLGYVALLIWAQLLLARALGAPIRLAPSPLLQGLLAINTAFLAWRLAMRCVFTAATFGWREGLLAAPRMLVSNVVLVAAMLRAARIYRPGRRLAWDKTRHAVPGGAGGAGS